MVQRLQQNGKTHIAALSTMCVRKFVYRTLLHRWLPPKPFLESAALELSIATKLLRREQDLGGMRSAVHKCALPRRSCCKRGRIEWVDGPNTSILSILPFRSGSGQETKMILRLPPLSITPFLPNRAKQL